MSDELPTPSELPTNPIEIVNDYAPEKHQHVAQYAVELAEYKEREARFAENDEEEMDERPDVLPDHVPAKATITIKEINDNRYCYWQWRDGDTIRSKYKGPINPEE